MSQSPRGDSGFANGYDISALKVIEREEVEAVLAPPLLADRTRCINGLNKWRISMGLRPVTTPLKSSNSPEPGCSDPPKTAIGNIPRNQWTSQALINRSKKGRLILEAFQTSKVLSRKDRIFITHLIVDEFVDEFGKLTREELSLRSAELKCIFPTVEEHIWYKPASYRDGSGKKVKLGRVAKGCLFDRNHNYRRAPAVPAPLSEYGEQSSRAVQSFTDAITAESVAEYQETKVWFQHHHGEWDDIKKRWKATSAVRLHEIGKLEQITYQHLLDEYPILKNTGGYQLVKLDFTFKHPTKSDLLFNKFSGFRDRAKNLFRNEIPVQGRSLFALLDRELSDDSRDCITILLVFYIWPSTVTRLPNGNKWKPSLQECRESSILHLKSLADYETELSRLGRLNLSRGLPDHPVIVVVGATIDHINQFFVSYKDIAYRAETFLKALDVVFKIYTAYALRFPIEASGPWNFIAYTLFDFEPRGYKQSKEC
ncbi:uncharacterized protein LOC134206538 [Armigeres subalbatus]|uniref:uncharacterized protein LOC134206538 n=1 Tax=Armigeres subalbatus TaxID=124917 RepID=UPI002ED23FDD